MRIHTDNNGVYVNAITKNSAGKDVEGRLYDVAAGSRTVHLEFQNGSIAVNGVNGMTNEALLAVLIHRTKHLDSEFGCDENKRAIKHMEEALVCLELRNTRGMVLNNVLL